MAIEELFRVINGTNSFREVPQTFVVRAISELLDAIDDRRSSLVNDLQRGLESDLDYVDVYDVPNGKLVTYPILLNWYAFTNTELTDFVDIKVFEVETNPPVPIKDFFGKSGWGNSLLVSGNYGDYSLVIENGVDYLS